MAGDVGPGMNDDGLYAWVDEVAEFLGMPAPCVCHGVGYMYGDWLYKREPECTCSRGTDDFTILHEGSCDGIPCPFCHLELSDEQ